MIAYKEAGQSLSGGQKRRLRKRLYDASPFCCYCDVILDIRAGPTMASLDHIIPLKHGGADEESNITLACWQCNRLKGSMSLDQMRQLVERVAALEAA